MINKIMKNNGIKAYQEDLKKLDLSKIDKTIQRSKENYERVKNELIEAFETILPEKSSFEK